MGGKTGAIKGGLTAMSDWAEHSVPALRSKVRAIAESFLDDAGSVSRQDTQTLLDYLRGPGSKANWKDMFPGAAPTRMGVEIPPQQIAAPRAGELWMRGGTPRARLPSNTPIFTTRQPEGAAWYATERSGNDHNVGSIVDYLVNAKRPARSRDMFEVLAENPGLAREASEDLGDTFNLWDRLYHPDVSKALQKKGFDSALGYDQLERGDIEALIALSKDQLQPVQRRLVAFDGTDVLDRVKVPTSPLDEYGTYVQIGEPRPFTKKKNGGLVE